MKTLMLHHSTYQKFSRRGVFDQTVFYGMYSSKDRSLAEIRTKRAINKKKGDESRHVVERIIGYFTSLWIISKLTQQTANLIPPRKWFKTLRVPMQMGRMGILRINMARPHLIR